MIYIIIYIVLAIIWAIYCSYRTSQFGKLGKLKSNLLLSFVLNFIIFPYSLYYAIKHKKI